MSVIFNTKEPIYFSGNLNRPTERRVALILHFLGNVKTSTLSNKEQKIIDLQKFLISQSSYSEEKMCDILNIKVKTLRSRFRTIEAKYMIQYLRDSDY